MIVPPDSGLHYSSNYFCSLYLLPITMFGVILLQLREYSLILFQHN